ncbi:hypothetical protein [Brevibacillus brevis]|uniref:hypothetical protein n=1 Tax=Brevibacillus brevis TaxID=1393 RepID=UPI000A832544|nr:hypothetical protein [Brevibacillus brevis]
MGLLLFTGDKIEYRHPEGYTAVGIVNSVSGSRIYLQSGYATYLRNVTRVINS